MFLYVLPALLALVVIFWIRDWVLRVMTKWKRAAEKQYELMKQDRWSVILEVMKIVMFISLLYPLLVVIDYATNENAPDPGSAIFNQTMPLVFIVITTWYFLAIVIFGIYQKNRDDREREEQKKLLQGID
jgi:hypothetical protein